MGFIRKAFHPELFQGRLTRKGYFEGWYFKLADASGKNAAAVIPGVALGGPAGGEDSHTFVQLLRAGEAEYFRYPLPAFSSDPKTLRIRVGGNEFRADGVDLDLGDGAVSGSLRFTDVVPFPSKPLSPGIMGPYGFVPGMQCYHGVVNVRHSIRGSLQIGGKPVDYTGGTGYVEKDWGTGFPKAWVWLQADRFGKDEAFLFSVADVPFGRRSFRGFFALLYAGGKLFRLATYTGARLTRLDISGETVHGALEGGGLKLEFAASPGPGGLLLAPTKGRMDRTVLESVDAEVRVLLTDASGRFLFEGKSRCAGMERYEAERLLRAY